MDLKSTLESNKLIWFKSNCFKKKKMGRENNESFLFLDFEKISS